ncbi:hypothetical protein ACFXPT_31565 [Streptomyces goshikiensis]|uniref:hypothetical protein n=1 Tax=Streptomyces goshikiensis TaxID=1942 RepID=UPI0036A15075
MTSLKCQPRVSSWLRSGQRVEGIDDLTHSDNIFVVIQPDEDDPVWFTSVTVLYEGGYEVVRRDTTRREHDVATETSLHQIARDQIIWMAARDYPGRPTQHTSNCQNKP